MPPSGLTPAERTMRAKIAANESWAKTENRSARTEKARQAMLDKFAATVDPDGVLPPAERAKRAENARRAHLQRMALRSVQARRRRAAVKDRLAELDGGGDHAA